MHKNPMFVYIIGTEIPDDNMLINTNILVYVCKYERIIKAQRVCTKNNLVVE